VAALTAVAVASGVRPAAAWWDFPPPAEFDPLRGMEPSGRIPKVPLPTDLPHPERWRYIPEGRIKPGNFFERFLVSSFAAPQVFAEKAIGVGGGIAITDIDFRNERRREFLGAFLSYTTEGQQSYRLLWRRWLNHRELPDGGVLIEERSHLTAYGGYQKTLTRRFFGLGPDTEKGDETSYIDEVWGLGLRADIAVPQAGSDWVATLGGRLEHHNLAAGTVPDRPTTDDVFPDLFTAADGTDSLTLSAGLRYDTRDSQHQPFGGWRVGATVDASVWQSTGEVGGVAAVYGNVAFRVPPLFHHGGDAGEEHPPTDTIALGAHVESVFGDLPFYDRPSLGGTSTLRGHIANRFTGDAAWHAVAEYRFWVIPRGIRFTDTIRIERVGLALFGEAGTVADSLEELPDADVHTSVGAGLRFSLERTAMFRVDVGFAGEGINVTLAFGLPF
jgi:hypothetical protein